MFVLNNGGYSAITAMQNNLFNGVYVGATPESGISAPSFSALANAYGILSCTIHNHKELRLWLPIIMSLTQPIVCDILLDINQILSPKMQSSKNEKGDIVSATLENMYPYLSPEEIREIMHDSPKEVT
jgi:acetolactate synthase-1/2/3 large subunit